MKTTAVLFLSLASFGAAAQNVKLETGKKINSVTNSTMNMDMGEAGGVAKIESATTAVIHITGADNTNYKADQTITRLKISQDGAGQALSYDSDNKADTSSDIAKTMSSDINQPAAVLIDKTDGSVKDASPEKPEETDNNPLGSLMGGSQSPSVSAASAFFVIPAGKKPGDKWVDSANDKEMSIVKNFEFQSVKDGIATVVLKAVTKTVMEKEAQGAQFTITMNGNSESAIITNTQTGLVKKNTTTANMEGTLEMMGQSMPLSMTLNSVTVFE